MCEELNENIKEIISIKNGQKYEFSINDSFGSKNRRRINIMNIPEENFLNQENQKVSFKKNSNSFQICKL